MHDATNAQDNNTNYLCIGNVLDLNCWKMLKPYVGGKNSTNKCPSTCTNLVLVCSVNCLGLCYPMVAN